MRRLVASLALIISLQVVQPVLAQGASDRQAVSDQMIQQLQQQGAVNPAPYGQTPEQVFSRLLPLMQRHDVQYRLDVAQNDQVNTTSTPDGRVVLFTGLLNRIQANPSAVAFVEAHELAHIDSYDTDKKVNLQVGTGIAGLLLAWHYNFGTQVGVAVAHQLLNSGFSRELDARADTKALALMQQAGYDPNGALLALSVAERMEANGVRVFPYKVRAVDRFNNTVAWMNEQHIAVHVPTTAEVDQLMAASGTPAYEGNPYMAPGGNQYMAPGSQAYPRY